MGESCRQNIQIVIANSSLPQPLGYNCNDKAAKDDKTKAVGKSLMVQISKMQVAPKKGKIVYVWQKCGQEQKDQENRPVALS